MSARNWAYAFFLWLSLATVLVPALASSGSPLRPTEGSAFSAFTSDVSLGPSRAAAIEQHKYAQGAPGDGAGGSAIQAGATFTLSKPGAAVLPQSGAFEDPGPPRPNRFAAGPIGARAPPRA